MKRGFLIRLLAVLLVALCAIWGFFYLRYAPTKQTVPLTDTLPGLALKGDEAYILRNGVYLTEEKGRKIDDVCYVPLSVASDIDAKYFYQESTDELLVTDYEGTKKFRSGSKEAITSTGKESMEYVPYLRVDGEDFIAVSFLQSGSNVDISVAETPLRIVIFDQAKQTVADVSAGEGIRTLTGPKSPVLRETTDEEVHVYDQIDDWTKIVTQDGYIGYVRTKTLGPTREKTLQDSQTEHYTYFMEKEPVRLGWHQVTNVDANATVQELEAVTGNHINVISPTWLSITDDQGNLASFCDSNYVQAMHAKGIKVWVLVDDFRPEFKLENILKEEGARKALIDNLLREVTSCGADGINIDFEHVTEEGAPAYLQFLRELYLASRPQKLTLSADNYVPTEGTSHYRRAEQSKMLDYFIIMGYDEHTAASTEAGSVASYDFVKNGVEKTVEAISSKKVINAVPFYTRLWKFRPWTANDVASNDDRQGATGKLESELLPMNEQQKIIAETPGDLHWSEGDGQTIYEAQSGGKTWKMWLEDAKSIEKKLDLIDTYQLGGVAFWKLGLETSDIWPLVDKKLGK